MIITIPTKEKKQLYANGETKKLNFIIKKHLKQVLLHKKNWVKIFFLLLGNHEVEPVKRLVYIENKKTTLTNNNIIKNDTGKANSTILSRLFNVLTWIYIS